MTLGDTTRNIILNQLTQLCDVSDIEYCLEIWLQTHNLSGAYFIGLMPQVIYHSDNYFVYNAHFPSPLPHIKDAMIQPLRRAIIDRNFLAIETLLKLETTYIVPIYGSHHNVGLFLLSEAQGPIRPAQQLYYEQDLSIIGQALLQYGHLKSDDKIVLTDRQAEIMSWVAQGKSNSEIAQILSISSHTIDNFMRQIFKKLGVNNRVSAVVKCTVFGVI